MTSVPAPRSRVAFPQIAGVSWEHPADRAALQALRAVPGFDDAVRKIIAFLGGERGIRLLPIRLAILEWSRKSELSSDRAGLLGSQNIMASQQLFMKMAGGYRGALESGQMALDPFIAQAGEYIGTNEGLDIVYKILN